MLLYNELTRVSNYSKLIETNEESIFHEKLSI